MGGVERIIGGVRDEEAEEEEEEEIWASSFSAGFIEEEEEEEEEDDEEEEVIFWRREALASLYPSLWNCWFIFPSWGKNLHSNDVYIWCMPASKKKVSTFFSLMR